MQFEPSTAVYDACRVIRDRVLEAQTGQGRICVSVSVLFVSQYHYLHVDIWKTFEGFSKLTEDAFNSTHFP